MVDGSLVLEKRPIFVVPFGQVDCGCGGKFRRGLRYWAFLFFVLCAPFCCVRGKFFGVVWTLVEWGVVCDAAATATVGRSVGVIES